jgi:hypothetical protein
VRSIDPASIDRRPTRLYRKPMRSSVILSIALSVVSRPAHAIPFQAKEHAAVKEFAKRAVIQSLNYSQGNRLNLMDAQDNFTPNGWRQFMKRMAGFLDTSGAPLGNSIFEPNGDVVITKEEKGAVQHLTVPGILKQSQGVSTATYQVDVDVRLDGNPAKLTYLQPSVRAKFGIR